MSRVWIFAWPVIPTIQANAHLKDYGSKHGKQRKRGLGDSHMVVTRNDASESCVCVCVCVCLCVCENDVRK